jgi:hypothetical protein
MVLHATYELGCIPLDFAWEAPTECNRTAAVGLFEDCKRDRYNRRARSLCDGLLLDQVGFVRDGGHAVCRAILFGG